MNENVTCYMTYVVLDYYPETYVEDDYLTAQCHTSDCIAIRGC